MVGVTIAPPTPTPLTASGMPAPERGPALLARRATQLALSSFTHLTVMVGHDFDADVVTNGLRFMQCGYRLALGHRPHQTIYGR